MGDDIVVATWPVLLWLQARFWKRRALAVAAMTTISLLVFAVPLTLAIGTVVFERRRDRRCPQIGVRLSHAYRAGLGGQFSVRRAEGGARVGASQSVRRRGAAGESDALRGQREQWFVAEAGDLGILFLQFLLTLVLTALMYARGEAAALAVARFSHRLAGQRGENAVQLASLAIRSVALGVVVTAVVQAALGGAGLAVAGVPFAGLLTAVMALLCISQVGPSPVLIPALVWLYWTAILDGARSFSCGP